MKRLSDDELRRLSVLLREIVREYDDETIACENARQALQILDAPAVQARTSFTGTGGSA